MADSNKPMPPGWSVKPPTTVSPSSIPSKGRVDFDISKFDNFIQQKGIRVKVFRSVMCPNVKSIDGGEHNIECPLCLGAQFIDVAPIETLALTQADALDKRRDAEGLYDKNTVRMTFARGIELQYFTLVELCDFTDIFFERIKRQRGQIDVLKYRACCINVLIDSNGKQYYQGQDFILDPNGSISWVPNKGPMHGQIYSVHYNMKKQFRAMQAIHVDRYTQILDKSQPNGQIQMVKMPEFWVLQKEYFVERKDLKGNPLSPNLIRDPDSPDSTGE